MSNGYFSKYNREVMRVFQIREHLAKIVKLGRYAVYTYTEIEYHKNYICQEGNAYAK